MNEPENQPEQDLDAPLDVDMPPNLNALVEPIAAMVRQASRRSLAWFRQSPAVDNKRAADDQAGFDPVTEADRAVEDILRAELTARFPTHEILGEERGTSGSHPYRWVIDPIDGTRSFISGNPLWGTLLGLQHHGTPVAGWMHLPVLDETYVGWSGGGWMETPTGRQPLRASQVTVADQAILGSTHPTMYPPGPDRDRFDRLAAGVRMTRYGGDCVNYGLLAIGTLDLVAEAMLEPYDIVPLIPIIEAAGAVITDLAGNPPTDGGEIVCAATPALHRVALDLIR